MPSYHEMVFEDEMREDIASGLWSACGAFLSSVWQSLTWDDIAQIYLACVGMYIALEEGIIPDSALYSGLIGGALGFFAHPFLKALTQAPIKTYHNRCVQAKLKHLAQKEEALIEDIQHFYTDYNQYNDFLCRQIGRVIKLKLDLIKIDPQASTHPQARLLRASKRVEALHQVLKSCIKQLDESEHDPDRLDQLLNNMYKDITSLSPFTLDHLVDEQEERSAISPH